MYAPTDLNKSASILSFVFMRRDYLTAGPVIRLPLSLLTPCGATLRWRLHWLKAISYIATVLRSREHIQRIWHLGYIQA